MTTGPGSGEDTRDSTLARELELSPEVLRRRCDPASLGFATTEEVDPLQGAVGQERALQAIDLALQVENHGYNAFATGPIGAGKDAMLETRLREAAAGRPTPADIVYLPNFDASDRPQCAELPAGRARELAAAMVGFVADARRQIPQAFESESYQRRRAQAIGPLEHEREAVLDEVREFAHRHGVDLELTPAGIVTIPLVDGKPVSPQQFGLLPDSMQAAFLKARELVVEQMGKVMSRIRDIDGRAQQRIDELNREVVLFAVGHVIEDLKQRFADVPEVSSWLDRVREDVIDSYTRFLPQAEPELPAPLMEMAGRDTLADRYAVNVFVSHAGEEGAPVVIERNPTFQALFGRIEYRTTLGAAITDHSHIRAGAIHRASGGYLLLHAQELLTRPFLWDKLKDILRNGRAQVENLAEQYVLFPTATLAPEPPRVDVKVVLVGSPLIYQLLYELDEDMRELFRVKVDFDVEMPWADTEVSQYAAFISGEVRAHGLRHFDSGAVAAVVEHGSRQVAHQQRLSTRLGEISDLLAQASHWAGQEGAVLVSAEHVRRAITERKRRSNLVEDKIAQAIDEDTLHIEVTGSHVGQVNGLAVSQAGDYVFGHPVRVTASAGPGQGRVVSIEREAKLSGHVHDKGFLTLRGFLEQRYGRLAPLSLSASLTFEQSYGEIDGDSAASTELYALLSTLADVPVEQRIGVTGSVDQHGRIQAVGAVTEKIEAFFATCKRRGLSGDQGVMIPAANVRHLMLAPDVIEAVSKKRFHVWAVDTIDQGIELLTGITAGERDPGGEYPAGTIHRRVEDRLAQMSSAIRELTVPSPNGVEQAQAGEPSEA